MAKKKEAQEPVFYYQRKLHTVAECRNLLAHFSLKLISYKNMLKGPKGPGFKTLEEDIAHRVEKLERLRSDLESFLFKYDRQITEPKAQKPIRIFERPYFDPDKAYTLQEASELLRDLTAKRELERENIISCHKAGADEMLLDVLRHNEAKISEACKGLENYIKNLESEIRESNLTQQPDRVNHPSHYTSHPSGVECITITEHYDFCVGNAIKYLWRCGLKVEEGMTPKDKEIEDLKKAVYYINRKIKNLEK